MPLTRDAILASWRLDPGVVAPLLLAAAVYLRGWWLLHRGDPGRWTPRHPPCFLAGLLAVFLALQSPIDPFGALLLQVHMLQHLLLMMAAPPLIWLGEPFLPLVRGLPHAVQRHALGPFLRAPELGGLFSALTHPVTAWVLYVSATWLWHAPPVYDAALRSEGLHRLEHLCFVGTGLLFWWPVVLPHPARPRWSRWLILPYLLLADVQNTALSALLSFSDRVLYPHYEAVPRLGGMTALEDQAAAGVLMWVPGSLAFLVPLGWIGCRLLFGDSAFLSSGPGTPGPRRLALPLADAPGQTPAPSAAWDLLRLPLVGGFLRWRHARTALQVPLLLLAGLIALDGFMGPQIAPLSLAGVLPWIHWRGLVVLGLLLAGNVSCAACPFLLPRTLARRWHAPAWRWPRRLRGKVPAIALLVLFFWAYEVFDLWDRPWWTAAIVAAYFLAALLIDLLFQGASFCKHVCPVGQFNFVGSLVSPLEVRARDPSVCAACATHDCLRGSAAGPGCELGLFLPRKVGSLDCTFCLSCVHACPADNVGIVPVVPGLSLTHDGPRSGIGRLTRRADLAALVLVLVFASLVNAAAMTAPVAVWQERASLTLGLAPRLLVSLGIFLGVLVLPAVLTGLAAAAGTGWSGGREGVLATAVRYSYSLAPLGAAMWAAHYSFHLFTSAGAAGPALDRFLSDIGMSAPGVLEAGSCCCAAAPAWLVRFEMVLLELGLLLSLYLAYRIARGCHERTGAALRAFAPWAVLCLLLFAAALWVIFQPMEMRGTLG